MEMDHQKIAKIIAGIVIIGGIAVVMGWIFDIDALKSILPAFVTMKFNTAISFILGGITLYFIAVSQKGYHEVADIVLPITTFVILLLMATILVSIFFGISTGIEELFIKDILKGTVKGDYPGRPSIATIVNFILIAAAGILTMFHVTNLKKLLLAIGTIISIISSVAIVGYLIDEPSLYYLIEGFSVPIAVYTAILFVMLGIGLAFLGIEKRAEKTCSKGYWLR